MEKVLAGMCILAVILSACVSEEKKITCPEGFVQVGVGCCQDLDNDYICDEVEEKEEIKKMQEQIKEEEERRVKAGEQLRINETELPLRVYMQRKTHLIYTTSKNEEEIYILDEVNKFQTTIFYGNNRYRIDVDETIPVGPLLMRYRSVDPPKSGNYAIFELYPAA